MAGRGCATLKKATIWPMRLFQGTPSLWAGFRNGFASWVEQGVPKSWSEIWSKLHAPNPELISKQEPATDMVVNRPREHLTCQVAF